MTNQQTFDQIIQSWESYLKGSSARYIRIKDLKKGVFIADKDKEFPSMFFLKDILKNYDGVATWFDDMLVANDLEVIHVLFRKRVGGNGTKSEQNFKDTQYNVSKRLATLKSNNHTPMNTTTPAPVKDMIDSSTPPVTQHGIPPNPAPSPFAPTQPTQNSYYPPSPSGLGAAAMHGMGNLGAAAMASGLGFPELLELKKKADKVDELKDLLAETKEDLKSQISKLRVENETLVIKNRDLDSKVTSAEKEKDIAVKMAQLEKKGFMDGEGVQKMLEMAPALLQAMSQKGGQAQPVGLAAPSNMSPSKKQFIEYLGDTGVTEEMMPILEHTLVKLVTVPAFVNDLIMLNNKEYGTSNG